MSDVFDFVKYQATGNDFVLIDDRTARFPAAAFDFVARLCDRHFGIGADGLILIRPHAAADFEMVYFNADGRPGSFCGNGSRAAAHFARQLGLCESVGTLLAADGLHRFSFQDETLVAVELQLRTAVEVIDAQNCFVDTGSPHHIVWVDEPLEALDLAILAPPIRFAERYAPGGTNVNFVQTLGPDQLAIRTWERGVEAETLSCGTGVTAAAVAWRAHHQPEVTEVQVQARGGHLVVRFSSEGTIWLEGEAKAVFRGQWG